MQQHNSKCCRSGNGPCKAWIGSGWTRMLHRIAFSQCFLRRATKTTAYAQSPASFQAHSIALMSTPKSVPLARTSHADE